MGITCSMIIEVFRDNPLLQEYCRMDDADRFDPEKAAIYVLETIAALIIRSHENPLYRNIHISPMRADLVMVYMGKEKGWQALELDKSLALMYGSVSNDITRCIRKVPERGADGLLNYDDIIPQDIQGAASWVPQLYYLYPERYIKDGKTRMVAHLINCQPKREIKK